MRDPPQDASEPSPFSIQSIQEMPEELKEKWSSAIIERVALHGAQEDDSRLILYLKPDGTIETMGNAGNSDIEIDMAHFHPLSETISALESHQRPEETLTHVPTSLKTLETFNRADTLNVFNQTRIVDGLIGSPVTPDALTHCAVQFATSLQIYS